MTAVPSSTSQPRLELAQLLAAEADLTAVDRFSRWHEAASTTTAQFPQFARLLFYSFVECRGHGIGPVRPLAAFEQLRLRG